MSDEKVTGGDILARWKVADVQLPRVADVYVDASKSLDETSGAEATFTRGYTNSQGDYDAPTRVYYAWSELRDEVQHVLAMTGQNTLDAITAIDTAIKVFSGTEQDNAQGVTAAGADFRDRLANPNEVNPKRPGQNPPTGDEKPGTPAEPDGYNPPKG